MTIGTIFLITPSGYIVPILHTPTPACQVPQADPKFERIMHAAAPPYPLLAKEGKTNELVEKMHSPQIIVHCFQGDLMYKIILRPVLP